MLPSMLCWIASTVICPIVPGIGSHTLFTKMSTRPKWFSMQFAISTAQFGAKMSATRLAIRKDAGWGARCVVLNMLVTSSLSVLWIFSALAALVQIPTMEQPQLARLMAMARPMPREAPVTMATLLMGSSSRARGVCVGAVAISFFSVGVLY
jgi:hypothetical protein